MDKKTEVKTEIKPVKKTEKNLDPCDKCAMAFENKSPYCKSCIKYKEALKWQEAK